MSSTKKIFTLVGILILLVSFESRSQSSIELIAKKSYTPVSYKIADTSFVVGTFIKVPKKLKVTHGRPGDKLALLKLTNAKGKVISLYYKGNGSAGHDHDDHGHHHFKTAAVTEYYVFDDSRNKSTKIDAGDILEAVHANLQILDGLKQYGPTEVKVDILPVVLSLTPGTCTAPAGTCCNLVNNGDFESYSSCPNAISQMNKACSWGYPSNGTSDYYNSCATVITTDVPSNSHAINITAHSGQGYAGLIAYNSSSTTNREYMHQNITALTLNKNYYVEMYVRLSDHSAFQTNVLDIAFTPPTSWANAAAAPFAPTITGSTTGAENGWVKISGSFTASQNNLTQITIGNFTGVSSALPVSASRDLGDAYYFIEDVYLTELPDAGINATIGQCGQPVTLGSTLSCNLSASCLTSYGASYAWTSSPADPSLVGQTTIAHPVVTPAVTTTYTLITTFGGTTSTSSVTVTAPLTLFANAGAYPTTILSGTINGPQTFNGTYYVSDDLTLQGGTFTFTPGTKFYVRGSNASELGAWNIDAYYKYPTKAKIKINNATVNMNGTLVTAVCDQMWNGFEITNTNMNVVNSEIDHSFFGIHAIGVQNVQITNSDFKYNLWNALWLENGAVGVFDNSRVDGTNTFMKYPYNGTPGLQGVNFPFYSDLGLRAGGNGSLTVKNKSEILHTAFGVLTDVPLTFLDSRTESLCYGIFAFDVVNAQDSRFIVSIYKFNFSQVDQETSNVGIAFHSFGSVVNRCLFTDNPLGTWTAPAPINPNGGSRLPAHRLGGLAGHYSWGCEGPTFTNNKFYGLNDGLRFLGTLSGNYLIRNNRFHSTELSVCFSHYEDCESTPATEEDFFITCNSFDKGVFSGAPIYGIIQGVWMGFNNQGSPSMPAGNKFMNYVNGSDYPLYSYNPDGGGYGCFSQTGPWYYYAASDEGVGIPGGVGFTVGNTNADPLCPIPLGSFTANLVVVPSKTVANMCGSGDPGVILRSAIGFEDLNNNVFMETEARVFPNPSSENQSVNLFIPDQYGNVESSAILMNELGETEATIVLPASRGTFELPLKNISSGIYILKLKTELGDKYLKVIKQ
jgi:hypothetical protein